MIERDRTARAVELERLLADATGLAEAAFSLTGERSLPAPTTAAIKHRDLVGRRYLALEQCAGPVGEALPPGGGIPPERTRPALGDLASTTGGFPDEARPPLRTDIANLGLAATTLGDSGELIEGLVQRLPHELETLTRTASYGSWSNFFLREARGQVAVPTTRSRCGW
ncbi:hypothetical protein [Actinosynnema sp.]|uniref:hypothetical protein n=1 Tax=Actinosynnema sp. TaxID=1872144 RepID=UPI003F831C4E